MSASSDLPPDMSTAPPTATSPEEPHGWQTPLGQYLLTREQAWFDRTVPDLFGFYALQIGLPQQPLLTQSRIPHRWTLAFDSPAKVRADPHALPLPDDVIDLIAMPHALEFTDDPHQLLREAHRVLRPEGRLLIVGINPYSLFGLCQRFNKDRQPPWNGRFLSAYRVKDWLTLLGFDIVGGGFDAYAPPFARANWLARCNRLEKAGDRWWPIAGGIYFLHAVKKVVGMRVITPVWQRNARRKNWAAAHKTPQGQEKRF
ncbi:MAG: class I SAM-dependent methyltransferase [Proteobacteria bacterium]|nr:class I SAM-dependent methyltransferase [Pseudomonadota bacterium]MCL2306926.1 class I SAM-dependent methyltransferase [Pseudomonadota bacterium]